MRRSAFDWPLWAVAWLETLSFVVLISTSVNRRVFGSELAEQVIPPLGATHGALVVAFLVLLVPVHLRRGWSWTFSLLCATVGLLTGVGPVLVAERIRRSRQAQSREQAHSREQTGSGEPSRSGEAAPAS